MSYADDSRSYSCENLITKRDNIYDTVDISNSQSPYTRNPMYVRENCTVPNPNNNKWVPHYNAKDAKVTLKRKMYHLSREQLVDFLDRSQLPSRSDRQQGEECLHQEKRSAKSNSCCCFCWFIFNFLIVSCIVFLMLHTLYPDVLEIFNLSNNAQVCLKKVNIVNEHTKDIINYIKILHTFLPRFCNARQNVLSDSRLCDFFNSNVTRQIMRSFK